VIPRRSAIFVRSFACLPEIVDGYFKALKVQTLVVNVVGPILRSLYHGFLGLEDAIGLEM
jgi:hypothetical protein